MFQCKDYVSVTLLFAQCLFFFRFESRWAQKSKKTVTEIPTRLDYEHHQEPFGKDYSDIFDVGCFYKQSKIKSILFE